jgi:hypothetical protein
MTRYKEYFDKMIRENKDVFDAFTKVHFEYSIDQDKMQEKYNKEGSKIQDIIRDYENKLCSNTERGMYNKYSSGLSEKFWQEIRKHFPLIDHIGLIIERVEPMTSEEPLFALKKISLR